MITIEQLYQQYESVNSALSTLHSFLLQFTSTSEANKTVSSFARSTEEISKLYFLADNLAKQQSTLIQDHDSLKKRLADLEQRSYNDANIKVSSLHITRERENPGLDFDSPEAKQIFSGFSVPPLLLSSNTPSSRSSACSSPRASLTKDCSQEIFDQSFFYVPPLILSSAVHSSGYTVPSPPNYSSTSFIQLESNEGNCRKKPKHIENEQKQLTRTKKHHNLLSLI